MRKLYSSFVLLLFAVAMLLVNPAFAQSLNVDIVGGLKTATPIVVVPFAQAGGAPTATDIADVIRNDFNRSGKFRSLAKSDIVEFPSRGADIKFPTWRLLKQDYITVGRISDAGGGMLRVEYELWDVNKAQSLLAQAFTAPAGDMRGVAHQIADQIYEKITGVRGAFWTRIAYITAVGLGNNTTYSLLVADSDGFNPQVVARSRESLLSPAWSPDGKKIAYVSFESGNSNIYIQDITTGSRQLVSAHAKGINGAPAWSPDGSKLAIALSYVGNLELFVLDLGSRKETRLTHNLAIDTEPVWAPDGQSIYFTSDRSGRPQIYQIPVTGGSGHSISFQGQNNSTASNWRWCRATGTCIVSSLWILAWVGRCARFRLVRLMNPRVLLQMPACCCTPPSRDGAVCCMRYRLTAWFASASCFPTAMCASQPGGHIGNVDFSAAARKCGGILPMDWARRAPLASFGYRSRRPRNAAVSRVDSALLCAVGLASGKITAG